MSEIVVPSSVSGNRGWRSIVRQLPLQIGAFVVVIFVWWYVAANELVSPRILPGPGEVVSAFWGLVTSGVLLDNLGVTVYEVIAGFILGSLGGFLIAVFASLSSPFRQVVTPYMVALQVTPRVAIAPLLFIWLGFGTLPKIVLAATICFFPVFINTLTGLTMIGEDDRELFRSLRASKMQEFFRLRLPSAMPVTFAGLKTAISLALIGAIVGEFVSAEEGLGLLIQRFSFQLNTPAAYAVLFTLTILGLLLYALMEVIDRYVVFWNRDDRMLHRTRRMEARYQRQHSTSGDGHRSHDSGLVTSGPGTTSPQGGI
jgi:NitT/TauT family transport system permease protein